MAAGGGGSVSTSLYAREVARSELPELLTVLGEWCHIASGKRAKAKEEGLEDPFRNSITAIDGLRRSALTAQAPERAYGVLDKHLVAIDSTNQIRAISYVDIGDGEITWLCSHPCNIRHPLNEGEREQVKGAGTCLVQRMAQLVGDQKISVSAYPSAEPFYEKLGFEKELSFLEGFPVHVLSKEKVKCLACRRFSFTTEYVERPLTFPQRKIIVQGTGSGETGFAVRIFKRGVSIAKPSLCTRVAKERWEVVVPHGYYRYQIVEVALDGSDTVIAEDEKLDTDGEGFRILRKPLFLNKKH